MIELKEGWAPVNKSWFSEGTIGMEVYSGSTMRSILEGRYRPKTIFDRPIEWLYGMREAPTANLLKNKRIYTIADLLNCPSPDLVTSSAQKLDIYGRLHLDFRTFVSVPPHARVVNAIAANDSHGKYTLKYVTVPKDWDDLVIDTVEEEIEKLARLTNFKWLSRGINAVRDRFGLDNGIPKQARLIDNETTTIETSERHIRDILIILKGRHTIHQRRVLGEAGMSNAYPSLLELCHLLQLGTDNIELFSKPLPTDYASEWQLYQTLNKIVHISG